MVSTQDVIECVVAQNMSFADFTVRFEVRANQPARIYLFFQELLRQYVNELSKSGFSVSPSNRIRYLETRNEFLEEKVEEYNHMQKKIKSYESQSMKEVFGKLNDLSKSAVKIQSIWRGLKTRWNLPKIAASYKRHHPIRQMNAQEKVVFEVKSSLNKINLTLEHAYRACDVGGDGIVTTEEFSRFLHQLNIKLSSRTINKFIEILDENCSGSIERLEFYDCLDAFSVASENHHAYGKTYSKRVLKKFRSLVQASGLDLFAIFQQSDYKDHMRIEELLDKLSGKFQLLSREIQALNLILDPSLTGIIRFVDLNKTMLVDSDSEGEAGQENELNLSLKSNKSKALDRSAGLNRSSASNKENLEKS